MGGFIGIELAIRFPARVERLVLVSAAGLSIESLRNERLLGVLGGARATAWRSTPAGWPRARMRSRGARGRDG